MNEPSSLRFILLLSTTSKLGGSERSAVELAAALQLIGVQVKVIAIDDGGDSVCRLARSRDVELVRTKPSTVASLCALRRASGSILVAFGLRWSLLARALKLLDGSRRRRVLISAQRGLALQRRSLAWTLDILSQRFVDVYLCNSRAAAEVLRSHGINPDRLQVEWSALADEWFTPLSNRVASEPIRIMLAGTDRLEKDHGTALDALRQLPDSPRWQATFYTSDTARAYAAPRPLEANLGAENLGGRVRVIRDRVLKADDYDEADILVHASVSESLPRVVLEALARGLQVVATDVGDTRALIGDAGIVVEPGAAEGLAAGIQTALQRARAWDINRQLAARARVEKLRASALAERLVTLADTLRK